MRRILTVSIALTVSACATASPELSLERPPTERIVTVANSDSDTYGLTIRRDNYISRARLLGTRQAVFGAIPAAFDDVGLPLPAMDQARWTGGVQEHRATRRLGNQPLSRFFDCGQNIAGANADTRRMVLSVYVLVQPSEDGETPVQIRADAAAHSTEGTGAPPITCTSQGALEQQIAHALQLRSQPGGR